MLACHSLFHSLYIDSHLLRVKVVSSFATFPVTSQPHTLSKKTKTLNFISIPPGSRAGAGWRDLEGRGRLDCADALDLDADVLGEAGDLDGGTCGLVGGEGLFVDGLWGAGVTSGMISSVELNGEGHTLILAKSFMSFMNTVVLSTCCGPAKTGVALASVRVGKGGGGDGLRRVRSQRP